MTVAQRGYALLIATCFAIGVVLSGGVSPAAANGPFPPANELQVNNSGYSNANLRVVGTGCGYATCPTDVLPGNTAWSSPVWDPLSAIVYGGAKAQYRLVNPADGYQSPWTYIPRSNTYTEIRVRDMFRFFGCARIVKPCIIQVIYDDPR